MCHKRSQIAVPVSEGLITTRQGEVQLSAFQIENVDGMVFINGFNANGDMAEGAVVINEASFEIAIRAYLLRQQITV